MGFRSYPDGVPLLAAEPWGRTGHLAGAFQFNREAAYDGVAVLLLSTAHCRMKMIFPTELFSDQRRLVGVRGTRPAKIQFLQADNVSRHARDHFRDAIFRALSVHSDTPVDVGGGDT